MKKLFILAIAFTLASGISSCGKKEDTTSTPDVKTENNSTNTNSNEPEPSLNNDSFAGNWKVASVEDPKGRLKFMDCEKEIVYTFGKEAGAPLSDGTATFKLSAPKNEKCENAKFGVDGSWCYAKMPDNKMYFCVQGFMIGGTAVSSQSLVKNWKGESFSVEFIGATINFVKG